MSYSPYYPDYVWENRYGNVEYLEDYSPNHNTYERLTSFLYRLKLKNLFFENEFVYYLLKYKQFSEQFEDFDEKYKFKYILEKYENDEGYDITSHLIEGLNYFSSECFDFELDEDIIPISGIKNKKLPELLEIIDCFYEWDDDEGVSLEMVYDEVLYWDIYHSDDIYKESISPYVINYLMSKILLTSVSLSNSYIIYDGFVGFGSSLKSFYELFLDYYLDSKRKNNISEEEFGGLLSAGLEIDPQIVKAGRLAMSELVWRKELFLSNKDSILVNLEFADLIISQVPFNPKGELTSEQKKAIKSDWPDLPNENYSEGLYVLSLLSSLKNDGLMTVAVSQGVLSKSQDKKFREIIVKNNYLDTVITLPSKISKLTKNDISILVFRKDRNINDKVLFIDASESYEPKRGVNELTDIGKIVETFENREELKRFSTNVSIDEIKKNDFNLTVHRYVDTFNVKDVDLNKVLYSRKQNNEKRIELNNEINDIIANIYF